MPDKEKSRFEIVVDLLKAVLWPLIVLFFFFFYSSEISHIIRLIPNKIESSSKISIGSISLEIDKKARSTGNEELGTIIKSLSEKGIRRLLTLGVGRYDIVVRSDGADKDQNSYSLPHDMEVLQELEKAGLLKADLPLNDFLTYYKNLEPIEKTVYLSKDDHSSTSPSDVYTQKFTERIVPASKLSPDQINTLNRFAVELSGSGKQAFNIIVHVVGEQIKHD